MSDLGDEDGDVRPVVRLSGPVVAALALTLLVAGAVLAFGFFPMHDGVQHVVGAEIARHLDDPARDHKLFFTRHFPVAAAGYVIFGAPLVALCGWDLGVRLFALLVALGFAWGVFTLAGRLAPERRYVAVGAFAMALSWPLYMGLYPFCVALALIPWVLVPAVDGAEGKLRGACLALGAVLVSVSHAFLGAATVGILGAVLLFRAPRKLWLLVVPIAFLGLSAWLSTRVDQAILGTLERLPPLEVAMLWFRTSVGGPWFRSVPVPALALVGFVWAAVRVARRKASRAETALALVVLGCLVLLVAVPFNIPRWQLFSPRFAALGVPLGLCLLPAETWSLLVRRIALGLSTAASLVAIAWSCDHQLSVDVLADDLRAVMREAPPLKGSLITVNWLTGPTPIFRNYPLVFSLELFAAEKGGNSPHVNSSNPALHALLARDFHAHFPIFPERFLAAMNPRAHLDPDLLAVGSGGVAAAYGHMLFMGVEGDDANGYIRRGFKPVTRHGRVMLAKFEPCPRTIVLDPPIPVDDLQVEMRWFPNQESAPIKLTADEAKGTITVLNAPCGLASFRVFKKGRPLCANIEADRMLVTPEATFTCKTPPAG